MINKLLFGTAGVPVSARSRDTIQGIERIRELGLDCMEIEFVRGVRMKEPQARAVRGIAKKLEVALTCHGPYFINLNSKDTKKLTASIDRILDTARIAKLCGGASITFHAGFYLKDEPESVYEAIKKRLNEIISILKKEKNDVQVRPELTGKPTQFGSLAEILRLSQEISQVAPCIDFAHSHARTQKFNSFKEFCNILDEVEKALGRNALSDMHIHISGVEYGDKGERKHLNLKDSDFDYKGLLKALKDYNVCGVIISESPNLEEDAILLKKYYQSL